VCSQYVRTYSRTYWEGSGGEGVWSGRVSVLARSWWRSWRANTSCRSELIVRRSSSDEARWTSATHTGVWLVVTPDNLSWPTRGPNVDATIGSTMRSRGATGRKAPVTEAIRRSSSPGVVVPDSACHAGGRGFESRRSRLSKYLQIDACCCPSRRGLLLRGPIPWPKRLAQKACKCPAISGSNLCGRRTK
jgi:hypothetical protein